MDNETIGGTSGHGRWYAAAAVFLAALGCWSWPALYGLNYDDYFQILTGRYILAHGLPTTDFISWTSAFLHPPLVAHEWLYQVTVASLYRLGGFLPILALDGVLCLAFFSLFAWLVHLRDGGRWKVTAAVTLVGGALLSLAYITTLQLRPQTGSLVLLAAIMVLLERGGKGKWWVLPLLVIGTNWHCGFWPIYVLVLLYYALRKRDWAIALFPLALLLALPGPGTLLITLNFAGATAKYLTTGEWQKTIFWPAATDGQVSFFSVLAVIGGAYVARPRRTDLAFLAAVVLLACAGLRFVILVPVLTLPVLASYWKPLRDLPLRIGKPAGSAVLLTVVAVVPLLIILGTAAGNLAALPATSLPRTDLEGRTVSPRMAGLNAAIDFLKARGETRVFNLDSFSGGYLAFAGLPPLVDNRTDIYSFVQADGSNLWKEWLDSRTDPLAVDRIVEKYGVTSIIAPKGTGEDQVSSRPDRYPLIFHSGDWSVYGTPNASGTVTP